MNRWLIVLSLACVLVVAIGCERRDAQEPKGYDRDMDSSPGAMQVYRDPYIIADQHVLSAETEDAIAAAPATSAAPTSPPPRTTTPSTGGKTPGFMDAFKKIVTTKPE